MADILYEITGGFFDSVNQDRTYSAEQMNMPYKKIVTDGIFPDKNGGASEDFIVRPDEGMYVSVGIGNALVGGKWAELDSLTVLRVPSNTSAYSRIDSIILRADTSLSVRAVCIVYRQGTEAASPTAPALESSEYVTELRLADITVAAGVSTITAANITDQRGTEECPWVAGAIPPTQAQVSEAVDQYFEENPGIFVVDPAFSNSSTNAVQNKVVKAAVDQLTDDVAGLNGRLDQYEDVFTGDVDESVQHWLDEHPEATTTVQDGSLTEAKLTAETKTKLTNVKTVYNVLNYGVKNTNTGDQSAAINAVIALCNDGDVVYLPPGNYRITNPVIINKYISFVCDGSIRGVLGQTGFAVVVQESFVSIKIRKLEQTNNNTGGVQIYSASKTLQLIQIEITEISGSGSTADGINITANEYSVYSCRISGVRFYGHTSANCISIKKLSTAASIGEIKIYDVLINHYANAIYAGDENFSSSGGNVNSVVCTNCQIEVNTNGFYFKNVRSPYVLNCRVAEQQARTLFTFEGLVTQGGYMGRTPIKLLKIVFVSPVSYEDVFGGTYSKSLVGFYVNAPCYFADNDTEEKTFAFIDGGKVYTVPVTLVERDMTQ